MPTYLGHMRMGFLNLLFGLVLLGVWEPYLLTPHPQSHSHHTRMSERVSVTCRESNSNIDLFIHLQRSQTIHQLLPFLHRIPPDRILPRIVVQTSLLLHILNGLRNLLGFLVCVAPILCPDLSFHFFCHILGAWPHHVRSPGVPGTHGLTEHPHPQHPHSQSPYLSQPALYSPIPHPSMQYPYMAPHPYPPPSAVLPESRTRKSSGPEETQTSESKRKRLNAGDAVESD